MGRIAERRMHNPNLPWHCFSSTNANGAEQIVFSTLLDETPFLHPVLNGFKGTNVH